MGKMESVKKNIWYIVLIAGVASVPLFTDYVLDAGSLAAVLGKIEAVSGGLGRFFPIRFETLGTLEYGYGAASFQADVFYLIPALLHLCGMGLGAAYKWTLLLFHLATAIIAFCCFERCCGQREIGLIGSMLYTWCPYRCSGVYLAGDLGETAAWAFLPIVLLGLKLLYTKDGYTENGKKEGYDRIWVLLTWGYSLLALSSTVFFSVALLMTVLVMLFMGKETFRRSVLAVWGKTAAAVVLVNAWFLVPMLLRLRDASAVGAMLVEDVRSRAMYLTQYLTVFSWGGDGVRLAGEGLRGAQAMGPGIAVVLLVLFYFGIRFTHAAEQISLPEAEKLRDWGFAGKMAWVGGILVWLSTSLFPWDVLENKNMLFSIILAFFHTPARLGIAADVSLILIGCLLLERLKFCMEEREYRFLLFSVGAVSFGTTQFLLGNILFSRHFVRQQGIDMMEMPDFSLLAWESPVWRLCEAVSLVALCGCVIMWIVRRRRS